MPIVQGARATHTTLESGDVARSLRFYRDVMGLRVNHIAPMVGHLLAANGHYAAALQSPQPTPQPLYNFYARPLPDAAAVDAAHAAIARARAEHGIRELTAPAPEDPTRFGVDTYGFYLQDVDGNWWRVEEDAAAFASPRTHAEDAPADSLVAAGPISYVALECHELARSLPFYRDFLGLVVEQRAPHHARCVAERGWVDVRLVEVGSTLVPQKVANHHGLTLDGDEALIDRLHAEARARAAEFGLLKVLPVTHQHGSYSFYLQDRDTNCWEIEIWEKGLNPVVRGMDAAKKEGRQ